MGKLHLKGLSILRIRLTYLRDSKNQTKMFLEQPVEGKV